MLSLLFSILPMYQHLTSLHYAKCSPAPPPLGTMKTMVVAIPPPTLRCLFSSRCIGNCGTPHLTWRRHPSRVPLVSAMVAATVPLLGSQCHKMPLYLLHHCQPAQLLSHYCHSLVSHHYPLHMGYHYIFKKVALDLPMIGIICVTIKESGKLYQVS